MPFILTNLHTLTHQKIDATFELYKIDNDGLSKNPNSLFGSQISPYQRLLDLISTIEGVWGLGRLLGGDIYEIWCLNNLSPVVEATRVFLKFKIMGEDYVSENENNDTCLHDALNCEPYTDALTRLLIQHGADPDQENDDHLTALAVHIRAFSKKSFSIDEFFDYFNDRLTQATRFMDSIDDLNLSDKQPHIKLAEVIIHCLGLCDSKMALYFLNIANRYDQYVKHPEILNSYYGSKTPTETILHFAAKQHSPEVLKYILRHGANPDLLDNANYKPIHSAVERLMKDGTGNSDAFIEKISLLLLTSLYQALPSDQSLTAEQIVDELLNLDLKPLLREGIANKIFQIQDENSYGFSLVNLLSLLKSKSVRNLRQEVRFDKILGEGTYGVVYAGKKDGLAVAIKLNQKYPGNYKMRLEAKFHENLSHPNIVNFICTLERKDAFGIVMEYANGGSLHEFIYSKNEKSMQKYFYSFSKQMHAGLKYLHNVVGVVHLDFKPDNILINKSQGNPIPSLKIADFGAVAKPGESRSYLLTTLWYCAPERFDIHQPFDFKNDTFSYGVSLGEVSARKSPWSGLYSQPLFYGHNTKSTHEIVKDKVLLGEVPDFGGANMPRDVSRFVKWCCQKNPKDRPNDTQIDEYIERKFKMF